MSWASGLSGFGHGKLGPVCACAVLLVQHVANPTASATSEVRIVASCRVVKREHTNPASNREADEQGGRSTRRWPSMKLPRSCCTRPFWCLRPSRSALPAARLPSESGQMLGLAVHACMQNLGGDTLEVDEAAQTCPGRTAFRNRRALRRQGEKPPARVCD